MLHFIGHQAEKSIAEYCRNLTKEIALNFRVKNLGDYLPAHLTFFPPFNLGESDVEEITQEFGKFSKTISPVKLTINGFGHFNARTIFLSVEMSSEIKSLVQKIINFGRDLGLQAVPAGPKLHLHISIARFLDREQFEKIWDFLEKKPKPSIVSELDNITIFQKADREWEPTEIFYFD